MHCASLKLLIMATGHQPLEVLVIQSNLSLATTKHSQERWLPGRGGCLREVIAQGHLIVSSILTEKNYWDIGQPKRNYFANSNKHYLVCVLGSVIIIDFAWLLFEFLIYSTLSLPMATGEVLGKCLELLVGVTLCWAS